MIVLPQKSYGSGHLRLRQQGMVLMTSLIMIVLLTLVVTVSLNLSLSSNSVSKNLNSSIAAQAAAQRAIESVISNPGFLANPAAVAATPFSVDANGDGTSDYTVAITASCIGSRPVLDSELNTQNNPQDVPCQAKGSMSNSGIEIAAGTVSSGNSLCKDTRWNIKAIATGQNNSSRSEINQGVSVRMPVDSAITACS